jgi:2-oxoglutarate dehydrogenase E1 component
MKDFSAVANAHPQYIDSLYQSWLAEPTSVEADWSAFFKGFDYAMNAANGNGHAASSNGASTAPSAGWQKEFAVLGLIHGYRDRGHMLSDTNPIRPRKDRKPKLELADYGLSESDLDTSFAAGFEVKMPNAKLRDIIGHLRALYVGTIGFENVHIHDKDRRMWLREKVESRIVTPGYGLSLDTKRRILDRLNEAVGFEQFLHTKFVGQKRFSLEGGESLIPALDAAVNTAAEYKTPVEEVVIGMAHRGRLNVLANTMRKTYEQIFTEFEGKSIPDQSFGSGDVKYHLGFSSLVTTPSGKEVYLKLLPNPSHLEAVDPVVEGFARAKADALYGSEYDKILPILIHGDAALAGQGVVYELIQMSQLDGYYTGGTIHVVVNNQIGFTANWDEGRSSTYCTQVAEVVQAPVFHVNGDDPEAVVYAMQLATEYRQIFNSDVFVDIVCYRRYGHNESDEPRFTNPDMYAVIKDKKDIRDIYTNVLIARGDIEAAMAKEMELAFKANLQDRLENVRQNQLPYVYQDTEKAWQKLVETTDDKAFEQSPETGLDRKTIDRLLNHVLTLPKDFKPIPQIAKTLENQRKLVESGQIDWSMGELLAYSSILLDGKDVRMSGQDVRRGTFSHRHAFLSDAENFSKLNRLEGIDPKQGKFYIYNSLLSEYAVLGFEYGYSLASPDALVLWEAQFGDFANGAHSIIDQFVLAGETKWRRMSGLVMLLPHGYEGQGPEHSSGRMERFLQGCAENNVTVANLTSASNFFHLLRRQQARNFRKPLIVLSPKSTLRPPYNMGTIAEIEKGTRFQELLDDTTVNPKKVKRLLVCSGKVYYDLVRRREETKRDDVAIVRIEQLYPFPTKQFEEILKKYNGAGRPVWVQEEPANMGAYSHLLLQYNQYDWLYAGRPLAASPATGFPKIHEQQQKALVDQAFGG